MSPMMHTLDVSNLSLCNTLLKKIRSLEKFGARATPYFLFLPEPPLNLHLIKLWTGFTLPAGYLLIHWAGCSPPSGMQEELFFLQAMKPIKPLTQCGRYILLLNKIADIPYP